MISDLDESFGSLSISNDEEPRSSTPIRSTQLSQDDTDERSQPSIICSKFVKIPELNEAFELKRLGNKYSATCQGCGHEYQNIENFRLLTHAISCVLLHPDLNKLLSVTRDLYFPARNKSHGSNDLNQIWTRILVRNNVPIRIVDDEELRMMMKTHINWNLPSRYDLSNRYIPNLSKQFQQQFQLEITNRDEYTMQLEFDHVTDVTNQSFLGLVATFENGDRYLVRLIETSLEGHSAASVFNHINDLKQFMDMKKFNSIISDSAYYCRKARIDLTREKGLDHLIQHRCFAHFPNRIGSSLTSDHLWIAQLMKEASTLASHVKNSASILARLKALGKPRVVLAIEARWYSKVHMISSLLNVKEELITLLSKSKNNSVVKIVNDSTFWSNLQDLLITLKPLADIISFAERKDASLGQIVKILLYYARYLFTSDWNNKFIKAAVESFLKHFNVKSLTTSEYQTLIGAYYFDRSNSRNFINLSRGIDMANEAAIAVALKIGYEPGFIQSNLSEELNQFFNFAGPFSRIPRDNEDSIDWWSSLRGDCLKPIGCRFARLKSSSTNTERMFSILNSVKEPGRCRISDSNLEHLVRSKLALTEKKVKANIKLKPAIDEFVKDWIGNPFDDKPVTADINILDDEYRDSFEEFVSIFDFTQINRHRVRESLSEVQENTLFDHEQLVKKLRLDRGLE